MTMTIFLILITTFSIITSLMTQGVKQFLDDLKVTYVSNIVVLIVALMVGIIGTAIYFSSNGIPFTIINHVYLFVMGIANWMGSMIGYDKLRQIITQIGEAKAK